MHNAQQMSSEQSRRFDSAPSQTSVNGDSVVPSVEKPRYTFDREAHVHRLDGQPLHGTSTIVNIISKELTWWSAGMALTPLGWLNKNKSTANEREQAALEAIGKIRQMSAKEWASWLQTCYRAHNTRKETAAVSGTSMHEILERYIKECIYDNSGLPMGAGLDATAEVERFADWSLKNVAEFLWSEAHCYSNRLWTGGICDCGALLKNGKVAILDFKSSKEAYFGHFVQAGGYAVQIQEHGLFTAEGAPLRIISRQTHELIVFPFGSDCEPMRVQNVKGFVQAFEAAVVLHKLKLAYENKN